MPSIPDGSGEQQDLSTLIKEVCDFAGGIAKSAGGFPPFACTVGTDGKPGLVFYEPSPGKSGEDLINRLIAAIREQARQGKLRAAGVAYMVSVQVEAKPIKAAMVSMQHRSGQPLQAIIPLIPGGKGLEFGEPVMRQGTQAIF